MAQQVYGRDCCMLEPFFYLLFDFIFDWEYNGKKLNSTQKHKTASQQSASLEFADNHRALYTNNVEEHCEECRKNANTCR
jgi:hypothetical protein